MGPSVDTDSIARADSLARIDSLEQIVLPDTTYASADNVTAIVTIMDSVHSPVIDNLSSLYKNVPGAFTFRGSQARDARFGGSVKGEPNDIVVDWCVETATDYSVTDYGQWGGGTGWTGQPLYVEWPDSMMRRFKQESSGLTEDFGRKEIILGSLCGSIYFINYDSGKLSRRPLPVGNPVKGTVSLDPTLNGNLYGGHGVPAAQPFGNFAVDLIKHEKIMQNGRDPRARRGWNAFDSSPVRVGQFLFWPGENGIIYKYLVDGQQLILHSTLCYTIQGASPGMESSMSVWHNYGYVSDNHGHTLCVNLNTLRPVWHYDNHDDTDATPIVAVEDGHPYIYTGAEIDRHEGNACFVKLDGLTGERMWETSCEGRRCNWEAENKHFDGGFYATSLLGEGDCENLIFCNNVANLHGQDGYFMALDRRDGHIVYRTKLVHYAWSSPVGFLNEKGKQYVVTADTFGNVYIIDGKTGTIIVKKSIGSNFESSPVVVTNHLVVGSRGNRIYKLSLVTSQS